MKLVYRPEIDGLRAIAVGAVILYHAQITIFDHQFFRGGFIGVDIFFVISGYLITSIILKELVTTGSFSFKHFYERRIRRLLPVLLFIVLISLPFAWVYLLPSNFIDFSKSILYSLGFSSNFYFHYSGQIYGSEDGLLKPFLHTWSLSVEEQYYIIFPVVLLVTFKHFRKYLIHILILGFIVSLGLAEWTSRNYPSASFYFFHTRMWELLAGSMMAYFETTKGHRRQNKTLTLILPTTGLILIGHSILFFNDQMFHPSLYTLSPIIGVCLIIWFSHKDELITKILSTKLFVGIGLISYSLYLWHYPIFAFSRIDGFYYNNSNKLFLGVIIIFLSIITYYFIEQPFRKKLIKKNLINIILFFICILLFFNLIAVQKKGFENRVPEVLKDKLIINPWNLLENDDGKICYNYVEGCVLNIDLNKKVFMIGDSHMATLSFDLNNRLIEKNYQFNTYFGCIYFPGFDFVKLKTKKISGHCDSKHLLKLKEKLSLLNNEVVIFGGRFPLHLSSYRFNNKEGGVEGFEWDEGYISVGNYKDIESSFKNEVLKISKYNKIILIYPIPENGWKNLLQTIFKKENNIFTKKTKSNNIYTTSYKVYLDRTKSTFELFDSIKSDNIHRVYPHKLFCDKMIKNRCLINDKNNLFYVDDNHPSLKGAEMINDLIMKEIEIIQLKSN